MALSRMALDGIIDDLYGNQELGRLQDPLERRFAELEQSIETNSQLLHAGSPQSNESRIEQAKTVLAEAKAAFDKLMKKRDAAHKQRHDASKAVKKANKLLKKQQQRMEADEDDEDEDLIQMQKTFLAKKEKAVVDAQKDFAEAEAKAVESDEALQAAHKAKKAAKKALKAAENSSQEDAQETDLEDVKKQLILDQNRYMQYKMFHAHFLLFLNELPSNVRVPNIPEGLSYAEFIDFVKSGLESIDQEDVYATVAQTNTPATRNQSHKRSAPDSDDEDEEPTSKRSKPLGPGVPVGRPTQGGKSITHGGYFMTSQLTKDFEGDSDEDE